MTFKQLAIGETFEFDRPESMRFSGMATGPWIKTGPRRYTRLDDGMKCRVGSINTTVVKVKAEKGPCDDEHTKSTG